MALRAWAKYGLGLFLQIFHGEESVELFLFLREESTDIVCADNCGAVILWALDQCVLTAQLMVYILGHAFFVEGVVTARHGLPGGHLLQADQALGRNM